MQTFPTPPAAQKFYMDFVPLSAAGKVKLSTDPNSNIPFAGIVGFIGWLRWICFDERFAAGKPFELFH